jgi:hypothetical protein
MHTLFKLKSPRPGLPNNNSILFRHLHQSFPKLSSEIAKGSYPFSHYIWFCVLNAYIKPDTLLNNKQWKWSLTFIECMRHVLAHWILSTPCLSTWSPGVLSHGCLSLVSEPEDEWNTWILGGIGREWGPASSSAGLYRLIPHLKIH